jgi:hypothetical protein
VYIILDIVPFSKVLSTYTLFQQIYNLNSLNFLSTIGVVNLGQEKPKSHRGCAPCGRRVVCRVTRLGVVPGWPDLQCATPARSGAGVARLGACHAGSKGTMEGTGVALGSSGGIGDADHRSEGNGVA